MDVRDKNDIRMNEPENVSEKLDSMLWDYYYLNAGRRRPANAVVVALVKRKARIFHRSWYSQTMKSFPK